MDDVLLITWHGIHELDIFPGLPDTGGQNIYVQNMAEQIHDTYGCRVTILNRGGFVHPYTERMREGTTKDPERELYVMHVADDVRAFMRKEYLNGALIEHAAETALPLFPRNYQPDLVISHFWDGGLMGLHLCKHFEKAVHVWVPHEPVGMKKAPLPASHHERHNIPLRERYEAQVLEAVDLVGSTSQLVRDDLMNAHGRDWTHKLIDIFPGVDTARFYPFDQEQDTISGRDARLHADYLSLPPELFRRHHMCEFGRSDELKDKDLAVEVFARVARKYDDITLFMNLDEKLEPGVARRIHNIIDREGIHDRIHIFSPEDLPQSGTGSLIMPNLIRTARVFLTMSVMEGFGMAACEAAASRVPVVGTTAIPVVTDHIAPAGGGVAIAEKDVEAAVEAVLGYLEMDDDSWTIAAEHAYESVVPCFTWPTIVNDLFNQLAERGFHLASDGDSPG